jgi:hypothetical protein
VIVNGRREGESEVGSCAGGRDEMKRWVGHATTGLKEMSVTGPVMSVYPQQLPPTYIQYSSYSTE